MSKFHALRHIIGLSSLLAWMAAGCGYTIRTTSMRSSVLENAGIERIYIHPVINNTYKAGAEIVVFNALQRKVLAQGELRLVDSEEKADAVIRAIVQSADYTTLSSTIGSNLEPKLLSGQFKNYAVASVYSAKLSCNFSLEATSRARIQNKGKKLWGASFAREKPFPASNQIGVLGTTSAIINDSEFERALSDLADTMMVDAYESLLSMF